MIRTLHRIVVIAVLLTMVACSRKPRIRTQTTMLNIVNAYEAYLLDNKGSFEFNSQKEFTSKLDGGNRLGIRYLIVEWFPNQDGVIIDDWGTPLQITRPEKTKLEIRSASKDRIFGTTDDMVTVHPRVPGAQK